MGNSAARRWRWLGTCHAWRTRGKETLQPLEQPIKIAVIGAPSAHYLGLSSGWSVVLAATFIVAWELTALIAGAFDYHAGVLERQMQLGNEQDPFKVESLRLLRVIAASNGFEERAHRVAALGRE